MLPKSPPSPLSQNTKSFWWFIILGGIGAFFYAVRGILFPFILGLVIAYVLSPLLDRLQKKGVPRVIGTFFVLASFFMGFVVFISMTFPYVQNEIFSLAQRIPTYGITLHQQILTLFEKVSFYLPPSEWQRATQFASEYIRDVFNWGLHFFINLVSGGLALANLVALIIITPLVAFYFLKEWPYFIQILTSWIPMGHKKEIKTIFSQIDEALSGFIRGQSLVCLILGGYYSLALSIIGLEYGFLVGLLTGLFSFIPYVGFFSGFVTSMVLAFVHFDSWTLHLMVVGIFILGQILEGTFLTPKLVGNRIKLHPLWVVFAVFSGAYLLGFLGMIIALPVAAILGVLVRYALSRYFKSSLYLNKKQK